MLEMFLLKEIKLVFNDGEKPQVVVGLLEKLDDNFLTILTKDGYVAIPINSVLRVKEIKDGRGDG